MTECIRLDLALVKYGYALTRSQAQKLIETKQVLVNDKLITKANFHVENNNQIHLLNKEKLYVSRAALKLQAGLDYFCIDVNGKHALDIGASTGGFSQLLLERGVASIIAIDVGSGQMAKKIQEDPRLKLYENTNARYLEAKDIGHKVIDLVVCDVSFISLRLALPNILTFVPQNTLALLLVKPQFETGFYGNLYKKAFNKQGVLKEGAFGKKIAQDLYNWLDNFPNWQAKGLHPCPLKGSQGNQEYILFGQKQK